MSSSLPQHEQAVESQRYIARNLCIVPCADGSFHIYQGYPRTLLRTVVGEILPSTLVELWQEDVRKHEELKEAESRPPLKELDLDLDDLVAALDF